MSADMNPVGSSLMSPEQTRAVMQLVVNDSGWVSRSRAVFIHIWSDGAGTNHRPCRYALANGDYLVGDIAVDPDAAFVFVREFKRGAVHWMETSAN